MKTVIIGGVAGGASAAARLRRLNEHDEIIILERGDFISFANCGLPYYVGGEITDKRMLTLQTPESFRSRFNIDVRIKNEAVKIIPEKHIVQIRRVDSGEVYEEGYDRLILSPGAKPIRPNIKGIDQPHVFTLRNIPDTMKIKSFIENEAPKKAVVVGGGYIGVEMAENLANAGLEVAVVELADHLIAPLDYDMAADVHQYIQSRGIKLYLSNGVTEITNRDVILQKGNIAADMVIMSVGVTPETTLAKECGMAVNGRGSIIVNSRMQTSVPDIYAVGDAVEVKDFVTDASAFIPLAGPANKQGRIAADNISGIPSEYSGTQGSSVLKLFDMTIAATGLNEKRAKETGIEYDKSYTYSASHASYYPGAENMSVKVLWDKHTHKLLGAQIVGFDGVDKRMDVLAATIRFGAKVTELKELELCYAPPFGSAKDPVNMVGYVAENVISGKVKQFFWNDVEALPRDGSVTLLDVRTKSEAARGMIGGFVNIPLDDLRDGLENIPKDKPVYVYCHSGLRSYIACRLLSGYGYDCYNLAGGWRLYESVVCSQKVEEYICTEDT
ncbi:NADPH-dependent 2,4-dienoyl-CoA reductase, sulfur reductase [Ruminococcus sp. YE71]|uniref:FAD-dependent oxidoreductase n=1 Tax=unclassified Ruminococcus TaxID=2608920 RepID=UPI00088F267D|nr:MULTISPECIES: FAD-dependent oxidoreductase [unclassified Ruminococcus]SDA28674.1 NADPH-dependent 2,4-dienoyl-CoA reductase, sulfur reductase [Ruminococcus sp. YE78]SFW46789.1 NADPH-dependent 2,4-dienoyl-CoA reductase, sulfur reductase [Ruminococcus sp. YE71]